MRQRMTEWIETAEERRVCIWAMAEQPATPAPSPMTKLRELLKIEAMHLRLALASSRPAA